ncbi:probable endo-1,3(4)-beta-glucanase ARB_01444, partial [Arachis duranensis]|uniref:glucan endo-1,3-beta-D-glucosidase n=1 Tax=Arachis duranensis TaxID=130453 RepID=A0A6P4C7B8_ARADU
KPPPPPPPPPPPLPSSSPTPSPSSLLSLPPPPSPPPPPKQPNMPFLFPKTDSRILPDPSNFFSQNLLSNPLPTNSFFQNFVIKNGDQPEYIHPYLIKSSNSSLSFSYPSHLATPTFISQVFNPDITISSITKPDHDYSHLKHVITSYSDLSVTLDIPSCNLRFFLVRGSPFVTSLVTNNTPLLITTIHAITSFSSNSTLTKHTMQLNNGQTWLIYTTTAVTMTNSRLSEVTSDGFSGIIRIALLPDSDTKYESFLDRFSTCFAISGDALFAKAFCVEYKWEKKGWGELLMLAHPLHLQLLSTNDCDVTILNDFKYRSIDGDLVGIVGDSWVLKSYPVSVTWHSARGIKESSYDEISAALSEDVNSLNNSGIITTTSCYYYGKSITRAARLALIAEEVSFHDVIPVIRKFLKDAIEPWLDGTFEGNGFLYDSKWGGIVTSQGSKDSSADFGFSIYNDHHYHLGYFLYAIAVLAKIDPAWGRKYKPQAYSLMADFMNLGRRSNSSYTRLRCFDLYKLHSWAGGLTEFADGRNQESTSEAVNAYYSAALMGLAYGDTHLIATGSTLVALEMHAAQMWWHVREGENLYDEDFVKENRIMGVLWANKRDSGLWFAPPEWRECRLGIQVLPLLPITETLFSDVGYVKELVEWTKANLNRKGVGEGWKGFIHAMEGTYDRESALQKIRSLKAFDDGNSLSNLLWWIHSRGDVVEEEFDHGKHYCWFDHYCH